MTRSSNRDITRIKIHRVEKANILDRHQMEGILSWSKVIFKERNQLLISQRIGNKMATKAQLDRNLKASLKTKLNILHPVNANSKINQLNQKEMILTAEEFNQKETDKLLLLMPASNTNNKFSNNNKTKSGMNSKCKNYNRNNSKWQMVQKRNKDRQNWRKINTMLCNRINSYSNCKCRKGAAPVPIEELKAHAKVNNNNKNKKSRRNQAAENLNIKLLLQVSTQVRCWLKSLRANRQLSTNKLKTNICNSKFKNS